MTKACQFYNADPENFFCKVNAKTQQSLPELPLLSDWLRDAIHCIDIRKGCDSGHCGNCVVLIDGVAVKSCSTLSYAVEGSEIYTLDGLELIDDNIISAVLQAEQQLKPFQCDYCKPAFIFSTIELLKNRPEPLEQEIRKVFAGLLCRCTGYQQIIGMVFLASEILKKKH